MILGFTADIHIKLGQKNVPIDWATNRYRLLFDKISSLSKKCDTFVIGGDVFDKEPTVAEMELYFELIESVHCKCIIFSGNHEALKKNTTFLTHLKRVTNRLNPLVQVIDDFATIDGIDYIPYNKLKEYHPADVDFHSRILCTHVRGEIPPHVKPEVPLSLFSRWDLVLAGDLHSHSNSQLNIVYPGSPVTTSFHRAPVETYILTVNTDSLEYTTHALKLPQLIRKTVKVGDPTPATSYDHTIYELEGDMQELAAVADDALVQKKVVRSVEDTSLILTPEMSLEQEVAEYLEFILTLPPETTNEVLQVFKVYEPKLSI